jgi:hypothetical protein
VQEQIEKDNDCLLFVSHGVTVTMCAKLSLRPKQNSQNSGVESLSYLRATSGAASQRNTPTTIHILPAGPFYILSILFLNFMYYFVCTEIIHVVVYK